MSKRNRILKPGMAATSVLVMFLLVQLGLMTVPTAQAQYTFASLHDFTGTTGVDGENPTSGLIADSAGNLYGTTSSSDSTGSGAVFEISAASKTETVLYTFTGGSDGGFPMSALVMDSAGNLYGTTSSGGANGDGAVFELTPIPGGGCPAGSNAGTGWCEAVIYSFTGGTDGASPLAALTIDSEGNLYSTTPGSGVSFAGTNKCGSVFKLSPTSGGAWTESTLYDFTGSTFSSKTGATDGCAPEAAVVLDSNGNLYGTTSYGGLSDENGSTTNCQASRPQGCGIVFELSPMTGGSCPTGANSGNGWCESILYNFKGSNGTINDGYFSTSDLTFYNGNLYGTTQSGGTDSAFGTVFELSLGSGGIWTETILHNFTRNPDGSVPLQGVVFDSQGNLYGTTSQGGNFVVNKTSDGTVYEISSTGTFTKLYQFTGGATDGMEPEGKLLIDSFGNLYGTSFQSGPGCDNNCQGFGSVWELIAPASATTTTVISSLNPSVFGESVTFTATIVPASSQAVKAVKGRTVARKNAGLSAAAAQDDPTGSVSWSANTGCGTTPMNSGTPTTATCTTSVLNAGLDTVTATYSGDAFNNTSQGIVSQTVTAAAQQINVTVPAPASAIDGSSFTVVATSTSGSPVQIATSGPCSNNSTGTGSATITMTSANTRLVCDVVFSAAATSNYQAATLTEQTAIAKPVVPTVSFTGAPASAVYQSTFTVVATTNASTTAVITATGACSISGTTVTMISGTGVCYLKASWASDDVYSAATTTQKTTAEKIVGQITWATPDAITYGTPLSATQLDATANAAGKLVYRPILNQVLAAGTQTLSVQFVPATPADYTTATATVQLVVNQAATTTAITVTTPNPSKVGRVVLVRSDVVSPGKLTGSVTVTASTGESCTGTVSLVGKANCSITFTTSGERTLTSSYSGDNNNQASTSSPVSQTVN